MRTTPLSERGAAPEEDEVKDLDFTPPAGIVRPLRRPRNGVMYHVAIYNRVSMDDAATGSHTLETQKTRCLEACDRKFGKGNYTYKLYVDDGISGGFGHEKTRMQKKTRPTLAEIAQLLVSGEFDGFVVYDLSRFMRYERAYHDFMEDFVFAEKITFVSAMDNIDLDDPNGRMMASIMITMHAKQRQIIMARNTDAARRRAELGYVIGNPGFGWKLGTLNDVVPGARRGVLPVPDEVPVVKRMHELYVSGWSTTRIAGELNSLGLKTRRGLNWTQGAVRDVIFSPLHSGQVTFRETLYPGLHYADRFWDPSDYDALLELNGSRKKWHARTSTEKMDVHLLSGFAYCHDCGKRLTTCRAQKEYRAYHCINGQKTGQRTCPHLSVRAEPLEVQVVRELGQIYALPDMQALLREEAAASASVEDAEQLKRKEQLTKALEDIKGRLARWAGVYSRGKIAEEQFLEQNAELLAQKAEATNNLEEVERLLATKESREKMAQRVREAAMDFNRSWKHLNMEERRQVLSLLIESCTIERVRRDITLHLKLRFLPERQVKLMIPTGYRNKYKMEGVESLTMRQLAFLHHVNLGKDQKQIEEAMAIEPSTHYFYVKEIRRRLNTHDIVECGKMARHRIAVLLHQIPLGKLERKGHEKPEVPKLSEKLMEVFPLLARSATFEEVSKATGLPITTIASRKKMLLAKLGVKTIFEAGQKLGLQ